MKNQLLKFCLNSILLFTVVGVACNFAPLAQSEVSSVGVFLVKMSYPSLLLKNFDTDSQPSNSSSNIAKEDTATDNSTTAENNTTATTQQAQQVMNSITTEDSSTDSITKTPDDIATLMQEAKKTDDKSNSSGKTSEEQYFGGGNLVEYQNVQVQSKIPTSFYELNIKNLLKEGCSLKITDKSQPTILVYHSHATESYALLDTGYYYSSNSRSSNTARNMVRVGEELVKYLEQAGFVVIHDKTIHDKNYNTAYDSSKASVQKYLEQYPTIDITIDVHRDTITYSNKTKVKPTAVVNGKKAAKMMIIAGCEYGSVSNFPDWQQNLKFDLQVQQAMSNTYSDLMRPILFSQRKYNMNLTHYSFLLEIGTDANTLDEACYSARLFAQAFADLLNQKYVVG